MPWLPSRKPPSPRTRPAAPDHLQRARGESCGVPHERHVHTSWRAAGIMPGRSPRGTRASPPRNSYGASSIGHVADAGEHHLGGIQRRDERRAALPAAASRRPSTRRRVHRGARGQVEPLERLEGRPRRGTEAAARQHRQRRRASRSRRSPCRRTTRTRPAAASGRRAATPPTTAPSPQRALGRPARSGPAAAPRRHADRRAGGHARDRIARRHADRDGAHRRSGRRRPGASRPGRHTPRQHIGPASTLGSGSCPVPP